jgi:dihydroorotate dehydrogenase electron transfer subunit
VADTAPSDREAAWAALEAGPANVAAAAPLAEPERPAWRAGEGQVVRNDFLPGKRHHYAVLEVPGEWPTPRAGQFYMLGPVEHAGRFQLRRPMSVARAWREGGRLCLGFLYTVIGSGTRALAASRERWQLLGPLGRPFAAGGGEQPLLVGGGRGVAPLVRLAEECWERGESVVFLNGAQNAAELVSPEELEAAPGTPGSLYLETTEDGSRGRRGRVLDLLAESAVARAAGATGATGASFFACGPHGLLAAVGEEAARRGRPAQVALEAHMACGVGICRSCVVPRAAASPAPPGASNARYILACLEGPVVDPATVDWENAL